MSSRAGSARSRRGSDRRICAGLDDGGPIRSALSCRSPQAPCPVPALSSEPADFVFLGDRRYVHGTTMFAAMADAIERVTGAPALAVDQFVVRSELSDTDGVVEVCEGSSAPVDGREPVALLRAHAGGRPLVGVVYSAPGTTVTGREERDRGDEIVSGASLSGPFSGRAAMRGVGDEDELVRGIVEATKRLHVQTLDGRNPSIRWVSMRGLELPFRLPPQPELAIEEEFVGELQRGNHRFTRARFRIDGTPEPLSGEIGFSFLSERT